MPTFRPGHRLMLGALLGAISLTTMSGCPSGSARNGGSSCESDVAYQARRFQGGFGLGSIGLDARSEQVAIRQIDRITEMYLAQSKQLCENYTRGVVTGQDYSAKSDELRDRFQRLASLREGVQQAGDSYDRKRLLAEAYEVAVPATERTGLSLDFALTTQRPDGTVALGPGEVLATGAKVSFTVRTSAPAHLYVFQKSQSGKINVLFPDERIAIRNPVPGGQSVSIPGPGAFFRLNNEDLGVERVYVIASLTPLESVAKAAAAATTSGAEEGPLRALATIDDHKEDTKGCKTRALELEMEQPTGCVRSRGLVLETADEPRAASGTPRFATDVGGSPLPQASFRAKTEAGDTTIVKVFPFEHVPETQANTTNTPKSRGIVIQL